MKRHYTSYRNNLEGIDAYSSLDGITVESVTVKAPDPQQPNPTISQPNVDTFMSSLPAQINANPPAPVTVVAPVADAAMSNKTKLALFGAAAGIVSSFLFGWGFVKSGLIGAIAGFGAGAYQDSQNPSAQVNSLLNSAEKLTDSGVAFLKDQYNKIKGTQPVQAAAIQTKLVENGVVVSDSIEKSSGLSGGFLNNSEIQEKIINEAASRKIRSSRNHGSGGGFVRPKK